MRSELEKAFGGCKNTTKCACKHNSPFEETNAQLFYVYDEEGGTSEQPVYLTFAPPYQLTVANPDQHQICLTKMDKCLVNNEASKCDCILSGDNKTYLVEIKSSSAGQRRARRQKAREQLGSTIQILKQKGIDVNKYDTKAIICFKSTEPRITNSASNSAKAEFLAQYQVELEEKNHIEF